MSEFDRRTSLIYDGLNDVVCPYVRDRNRSLMGVRLQRLGPLGRAANRRMDAYAERHREETRPSKPDSSLNA